jgi:serine/threonine protein kinase/Tol biopolymer transport system component
MPLTPGVRLGPYEILAPVGAGGMGEVYRAHDSRLARDVALKTLPWLFSTDAERLTRFEQEARAAAALNHPNIIAVYDVGQHDGAPYVVSELLVGNTLRELLTGGAMPVRRVAEYAIQIASGLAAAHEKGIVHRDLKPENIFVTADGQLKILDFGLAKLTQPERAASAARDMPTTPPNTQAGVILGTAGYMSPEQVRGQAVNGLSDIFALGAIVSEMLSGQRAFRGETAMDAMTSVLREDPPDLSRVIPAVPPALVRIVDRCLEKTPARRFKSADDLAFALDALSTHSSASAAVVIRAGKNTSPRWWIAAAAMLAVLITAVAIAAYRSWPAGAVLPTLRVEITTPATYDQVSFALSPDGERIAFVASSNGRPTLWVRSLRTGSSRELRGTDGAMFPFWSPDSATIGFFASDALNSIDVDGGSFRAIARAPVGTGGSWSRDGTILFTPVPDAGIMRVSAAGGSVAFLPGSQPAKGGQRFPQFLPDGKHFIYFIADVANRGVYVGNIDTPERRRLFDADAAAVFVPPASLLLVRAGTLFAQRLDPTSWTIDGAAVPVAESVMLDAVGAAAISASATGSILYRAGGANRQRQLAWFDRSGKALGNAYAPDAASPLNPVLSPDGRQVALNRTVNGNTDIWLLDLSRAVLTRFTSDPTPEIFPIWSPDGRQLAYGATDLKSGGGFNLAAKAVAQTGAAMTLLDEIDTGVPVDWSRDGRYILYRKIALLARTDAVVGSDLWASPVDRNVPPFAIAKTPFDERTGQFSPDSAWVAFESNESGRFEIYVQPFPEPSQKTIVSKDGGLQPRWSPDGKEIFFIAPDGELLSVSLRFSRDGRSVDPAAPVPLFHSRVGSGGSNPDYVITPDGQRFLMNTFVEQTAAPLTMILNWAGIPN